MRDTVLIEEMTWPEVKEAIAAGKKRVIVMIGAMEQHGPHLPLGVDTYLGYALAERLARRLGDALVAPVVTLGFSEMNMPMAGTVSLEIATLQTVILDVSRSLARHGFQEILLLPSHAGNYPVLRGVLERVRSEHPRLRISAKTEPDPEGTKQFALQERLEVNHLGAHAEQSETSEMLSYRSDLVRLERACEGFMGGLSPYVAEFLRSGAFPPIDTLNPNGILGDARGSSAEIGEKSLRFKVERLARLIEEGSLAPRP